MLYSVRLYSGDQRGHLHVEADSPEEAARIAREERYCEAEWETLDCEIGGIEVVEVDGPDEDSDPIYTWMDESRRFDVCGYGLKPFLKEVITLLNSQPRFTHHELDSYEAASRLSAFLNWIENGTGFDATLKKGG